MGNFLISFVVPKVPKFPKRKVAIRPIRKSVNTFEGQNYDYNPGMSQGEVLSDIAAAAADSEHTEAAETECLLRWLSAMRHVPWLLLLEVL